MALVMKIKVKISYFLIILSELFFLQACKNSDQKSSTEQVKEPILNEKDNIDNKDGVLTNQADSLKTLQIGTKLSKEERALRLLKEFVRQKLKKYQHLTILGKVDAKALKLNKYVLLLDENGVVIDRALILADGSFSFKKLPEGKYSVILEIPVPDVVSEISMVVVDDTKLLGVDEIEKEDEKILENAKIGTLISPFIISRNKLLEIPVEEIKKYHGKIKGVVLSSEKSEKLDNITLLLVDSEGKVSQKIKTNTVGEFSFEKLPVLEPVTLVTPRKTKTLTAKLIEEVDETKLPVSGTQTNVNIRSLKPSIGSKPSESYINENRLAFISKDLFRDDVCILRGVLSSETHSLNDRELLLLDSEGKVFRKVVVSSNGYFVFEKLPYGDYQLLLDGNKSGFKVSYSVETDDTDLGDIGGLSKSQNLDIENLINKRTIGQVSLNSSKNVSCFFYENVGRERKPIAQADIMFIDDKKKIAGNARTDANGYVHIKKLAKGNYYIVTLKDFSKSNVGIEIKYTEIEGN
jgi:hypothetical protein